MYDKNLRDVLPQSLPILPSSNAHPETSESPVESETSSVLHHEEIRILETPSNTFGLFRRYHAKHFPSHDPEAKTSLSMLSNIVTSMEDTSNSGKATVTSTPPNDDELYGPYPNKKSFLLGEWYWGQASQKSLDSFKKLLEIIGSDTFSPTDIQCTNWRKIDNRLAINGWDRKEWVDDDAGWHKSPVTIRVPFHRLAETPGPREYTVLDFYHRSLISVIRERVTNAEHNPHFHYEPYELYWQTPSAAEPLRLHGELYTSSAFNTAHQDLQNLPGEPGCDLPRVVVALMFWSDGTHLTTFGNAKLWPLYMFFGNESKYRRCAPSCNLCEHVAYFEEVISLFLQVESQHH
jgi:hypothetical protein